MYTAFDMALDQHRFEVREDRKRKEESARLAARIKSAYLEARVTISNLRNELPQLDEYLKGAAVIEYSKQREPCKGIVLAEFDDCGHSHRATIRKPLLVYPESPAGPLAVCIMVVGTIDGPCWVNDDQARSPAIDMTVLDLADRQKTIVTLFRFRSPDGKDVLPK